MEKKRNNRNANTAKLIYTIIIIVITVILACTTESNENKLENDRNIDINTTYSALEDIPDYQDEVYVAINNNKPYFTEVDYTTQSFERYSELDSLGRCGVAFVNVCKEIMPPDGDTRGDISSIRPTGWKQAKFNGEYLYNRCHLIAYSLSDEDDNELNLITGTRYFNVQGMLPFERLVLEYIKKNKNNHVLYRVTPIFKGNNLLVSGVEMEAYSVEDAGEGVCFNVYVYNVEPGATINYATGELID